MRQHPIRTRLAATAVTTLVIGIGLSACGAGDEPRSSAGTPSTVAPATASPTAGPAYDPSYQGRTVTVRIVAYGHSGQTTTETRTVPLPR